MSLFPNSSPFNYVRILGLNLIYFKKNKKTQLSHK